VTGVATALRQILSLLTFILLNRGSPGNQIKPLGSACKATSRLCGKKQSTGLKGPRTVLLASLLRPARLLERSPVDRQTSVDWLCKLESKKLDRLASKNYPLNSTAKRFRFRGSRSVDLVGPLRSSPLRPSCARPLGGPCISSATWHRLVSAACCLGCLLRGTTCSLATWPCLCTPAACTGAGAPARGASYWGHPLSESNAPPPPPPPPTMVKIKRGFWGRG
jgi:hypothetical protein